MGVCQAPTPAPLFAQQRWGSEDEDARRRTHRVVALAAEGDRDAFRELYLRFAGPVHRHIRRIVRDEHEVQDITQLVFLKLMDALPRYDERQGAFEPWLLRVARNLAIDQIRRRRAIPAEHVYRPHAAVDETGVHRARALQDALARLSDDQREVLVMRQIVGMGPREIASRLHKTEGSVHALHHRARAAMRASLLHSGAAPATRGGASRCAPAASRTQGQR